MSHAVVRALPLAALGLLLAGPGAPPVGAQRADALVAGARVRVRPSHAPPSRVVGTVVRSDSAMLVVQPSDGAPPLAFVWRDVREVAVSTERRTWPEAFGRGALRGALVGGAVGLVATGAMAVYEYRNPCDCFIPGTVVVGAYSVAFTAVTALVGGAIGVTRRDVWRRVRPPS